MIYYELGWNMWIGACLLSLCGVLPVLSCASDTVDKPNIVLILTDDLGWTDLSCYGSKYFKTQNLDKMAVSGIRLTQFYAAHPVCSPSRAGLLTGCYPTRIGFGGGAFWTHEKRGIHPDETTIPEILRQCGYDTAMFGKWHIGDHPKFMPNSVGFSHFEGIPFSNSMWSLQNDGSSAKFDKLPWFADTSVTDYIDSWDKMNHLTQRVTQNAVQYIKTHADTPFFLYVAHPMPHVPLGVSEKFKEKSGAGLYGDVIAELDDSAGQILKTLKETGLDQKTFVIFTSDNGPWLNYGNHSGTCDGLREGKGTSFEGGYRVPCILSWPGHIPAGRTSNQLVSALEFLPTFAQVAGAELPKKQIDGVSMLPLLLGEDVPIRDSFYFYYGSDGRALQAVTDGHYKWVFKHAFQSYDAQKGKDGKAGMTRRSEAVPALYDLRADSGETIDVQNQFPFIVQKLKRMADDARVDLGDSLQKRYGKGCRSAGKI